MKGIQERYCGSIKYSPTEMELAAERLGEEWHCPMEPAREVNIYFGRSSQVAAVSERASGQVRLMRFTYTRNSPLHNTLRQFIHAWTMNSGLSESDAIEEIKRDVILNDTGQREMILDRNRFPQAGLFRYGETISLMMCNPDQAHLEITPPGSPFQEDTDRVGSAHPVFLAHYQTNPIFFKGSERIVENFVPKQDVVGISRTGSLVEQGDYSYIVARCGNHSTRSELVSSGITVRFGFHLVPSPEAVREIGQNLAELIAEPGALARIDFATVKFLVDLRVPPADVVEQISALLHHDFVRRRC